MGRDGQGAATHDAEGLKPVSPAHSQTRLRLIKLLHTIVWAFFASCILAIPCLAWHRAFGWAFLLAAIVLGEVLVLAFNQWVCPITPLAARHTEDRRANFDIYLPEWVAEHNKTLFGALYLAGTLFTCFRWWKAL